MKITSKNIFTFGNELFGLGSNAPKLTGSKEDIKLINETYLNDDWLNEQKLSTGNVNYGNSTYILPEYNKSFAQMKALYEKCIFGNIKLVEGLEQSIKPFEQLLTSGNITPDAVNKAKALKGPKLKSTPVPTTEQVPKPDKAGLKALAKVYVETLNDRTNFESVESHLEGLTQNWYGVNSKYRKGTTHDSNGDLLVRAVSGVIENVDTSDTHVEYQSNAGFARVKKHLLEDIIKLFKATL